MLPTFNQVNIVGYKGDISPIVKIMIAPCNHTIRGIIKISYHLTA